MVVQNFVTQVDPPIMDYFSKTHYLSHAGIPFLMWNKSINCEPISIISYVWGRILLSGDYEAYLDYIRDVRFESH